MSINLNKDRYVHSIKTALAVLIGFALTEVIEFQIDQWLIITILVVMCAQMNVGSILQKSYMRFLGSLIGSVIAVLTLTLMGNSFLVTTLVVSISALVFSFIATSPHNYQEAGTLGVVTIAIILIGPHPTLTTAAERFLEISIGILIAALVSQFILPMHASFHLRENQARTIKLIREFFNATLNTHQGTLLKNKETIDEDIVKLLITQRKLSTDATRELIIRSYDDKVFKKSLWCEKEILRCIIFMKHAYDASIEVKNVLDSLPSVKNFNEKVSQALETIANSLKNLANKKMYELPNFSQMAEDIEVRSLTLSEEDKMDLHTFLFCAKILCDRIQVLNKLINKIPTSE